MGHFNNSRLGYYSEEGQVREAYTNWLYSLVARDDDEEYTFLIKRLQGTPFLWTVPNDDNRIVDGLILRDQFIEENELGAWETWALREDCSVLEVLIGISTRIEHLMDNMDAHEHRAVWFWDMLHNLGLDAFNDYQYHYVGGNFKVTQILLIFMERKYDSNGLGGIFPLRTTKNDQRKVEIWYQMNEYLNERYYGESF